MKEHFKITLRNRFQALQELPEDEGTDINTQWNEFKEAINATCEEVLGRQKHTQKEWITAGTLKKIQCRKERKAAVNNSRTRSAKAMAQAEYTAANKEVKKLVKQDKRNFVENLAKEAEEAAGSQNMKRLYEITKKLSQKQGQADRPVKDKDGKPLVGEEQQLERWAEHFEELLNRSPPLNPPEILERETDLPINCEPPTVQEIKMAIMKSRNGKAAGPDEIPAEALKADLEATSETLHRLLSQI